MNDDLDRQREAAQLAMEDAVRTLARIRRRMVAQEQQINELWWACWVLVGLCAVLTLGLMFG